MKGLLPKAYLRIDPNIDQHPDAYLLLDLMCAGARQTPRGRFRSIDHAIKAMGRKKTDAAKDRKHLRELPDGTLYIDGWDEWQEGDLTVGERVRRLRDKRHSRYNAVTPSVTEPLPDRKSPSEAIGDRRIGGEANASPEPPKPPAGGKASAARRTVRGARGTPSVLAETTAERLLECFNRTFSRRMRGTPRLLADVEARLADGYQPDELVALPILVDAQGIAAEIRKALQVGWLLRNGDRTYSRDGETRQQKAWVEDALQKADRTKLWSQHVTVARDLGVLEMLLARGVEILPEAA